MGITIAPIPYVIPGTSGNVLTSDGSVWTSAAAGGSAAMTVSTIYETSGRFTANTSTGTLTYNTTGLLMDTTATANAYCQNYLAGTSNSKYFSGNPAYSGQIIVTAIGTDFEGYFGIDGPQPQAGATIQRSHITFKLKRVSSGTVSLFGSNSDGTTESNTAALTTVVAGDVLELYLKVTGTTNVAYYWRKNASGAWSSATNLTTNIPTTYFNSGSIGNCLTNVGVATQTQITVVSSTYTR